LPTQSDMMNEEEFNLELVELGKRLKQLRKYRKLRLLDLEMRTGINDSLISRYEKGKENISYYTLWKLATALKVSINDLTDYKGPLPDNTNFEDIPKVKKRSMRKG